MKRLIWLFVFTLCLCTVPSALAVANSDSLSGVQIFPKDHIWNVPITTMPVDPRSAVYVNGIGASSYLGTYRGVPYNVVNDSVIHQNVVLLRSWSDFIPYPIPENPLIEAGGSDKHMIIVDRDENMLYEFYKANQSPTNGTWYAQSGFSFNLSGYALRAKGYTTASESGLPILPGLVRYDEVSSGAINHALRVSVPATNHSYVWPARANGNDGNIDGRYPPMGQRFRLKASFNTSGYSPQAKTILEALKKYGMIVSGMNGETSLFQLTFAPDTRWNTNDISALYQVHGSDFEAVDVSSLMINENSGQARTTVTPTPTPTPVPPPPTAQFTANITAGQAPLSVQFTDQSVSAGTTSYTWDINNDGVTDYTTKNPIHTYQAAGDYTVNLIVTNTSGSDSEVKSNYIRVTAPLPPASSITVTTPNGGERWKRGTSQTISWNYAGSPGSTVKIVLLKGSVQVGTIADNRAIGSNGKGSYTWPISSSVLSGSNYKISVQSTSQSTIKDMSDNYFTIRR
jgi:PKD repeat protein